VLARQRRCRRVIVAAAIVNQQDACIRVVAGPCIPFILSNTSINTHEVLMHSEVKAALGREEEGGGIGRRRRQQYPNGIQNLLKAIERTKC